MRSGISWMHHASPSKVSCHPEQLARATRIVGLERGGTRGCWEWGLLRLDFTVQGVLCISHMQTGFGDSNDIVPLRLWPRMEIKPLSVPEDRFLPSTLFPAGLLPRPLAAAWGICCSQHPANTVKVIFALSSGCLQASAGISCPGLLAEAIRARLKRLAEGGVSQAPWHLSRSQKGTAPNPAPLSFLFGCRG